MGVGRLVTASSKSSLFCESIWDVGFYDPVTVGKPKEFGEGKRVCNVRGLLGSGKKLFPSTALRQEKRRG